QDALCVAGLRAIFRAGRGIDHFLQHLPPRLKEAPEPGAAPAVTHGALPDPIEPTWKILAIEPFQFAPPDQKTGLNQVVQIRVQASKGARPARHLGKPLGIDLVECRLAKRRLPRPLPTRARLAATGVRRSLAGLAGCGGHSYSAS